MAKFMIEEKIEAVKRYLEGNESCQTIASELGVFKSNVQFRTLLMPCNLPNKITVSNF